MSRTLSRSELCDLYLEQLPFAPYPVQEDALLAWFSTDSGVLLCAPTGMGKTVIAEAAMFEALHTGRRAYYTTPLIALTEQKFAEMQANAVRWGFRAEDVGLVTGNRRVNPDATVLVVVAEILLNRLLHSEAFRFDDVSAVVMDEFHSFSDPERGVVWELTLALLPKHVRLLLLSATVGNAFAFLQWLKQAHGRSLELIESNQRRVPLTFQWIGDKLVNELVEEMAQGPPEARLTPALLFCFNREECWTVAEQLKGRSLVQEPQRSQLLEQLKQYDFSHGAGSKLKQLLQRGVGVHHAGMLPKYRRVVEELYLQKLLQVCVCTETLAAGINLPARSVVLTTLMKGPFGRKRLIDSSTAHQIFGRAGRPQFDTRGYVLCLAHEDDVRILRWKQKYEAIPEDTKDPVLLKQKKLLKRKKPRRRENEQYWNEAQFEKLRRSPPQKLASRGPLPWRLLAYWLSLSPEVEDLLHFVRHRLMDAGKIQQGIKALSRMLRTLHEAGYVELAPPPPQRKAKKDQAAEAPQAEKPVRPTGNTLGSLLQGLGQPQPEPEKPQPKKAESAAPELYMPRLARPTEKLQRLLVFRGVNPLYGDFLIQQLGIADRDERIQAMESVLEVPGSLMRKVRVPSYRELPPGPLATTRLDPELVRRGLMAAETPLVGDEDEEEDDGIDYPPLAEKLRLYFESEYGYVDQLRVRPVWIAGELLDMGDNFDKYVKAHDLVKQEGIVFRHLLRLILLCHEFAQLTPPDTTPEEWTGEMETLAARLTESCRRVDPQSTDKMIEEMQARDRMEP